jgi:hypothetical protein
VAAHFRSAVGRAATEVAALRSGSAADFAALGHSRLPEDKRLRSGRLAQFVALCGSGLAEHVAPGDSGFAKSRPLLGIAARRLARVLARISRATVLSSVVHADYYSARGFRFLARL